MDDQGKIIRLERNVLFMVEEARKYASDADIIRARMQDAEQNLDDSVVELRRLRDTNERLRAELQAIPIQHPTYSPPPDPWALPREARGVVPMEHLKPFVIGKGKIPTIKLVRELTNSGLREAKDLVDGWVADGKINIDI